MGDHDSCLGCLFFKNMNTIGTGLCSRYPPVPVAVIDKHGGKVGMDTATRYPEVQSNMWCGEYQPNE